MAKEMIFSSAKKTVYRDGDTAIKEFCEGFPKAEVDRPDYRVGVPKRCKLSLLLDNVHGAYKPSQCPTYTSIKGECDGQPYSISYPLGGYGTAIFRF